MAVPAMILALSCGSAAWHSNGLTSHYNATTGDPPTADDFWTAMQKMYDGGPRLTGNANHKAFLDTLETELTDAGFSMQRDNLKFPRWDVTNYSLVLHGAGGDTEVKVRPSHCPHVAAGV